MTFPPALLYYCDMHGTVLYFGMQECPLSVYAMQCRLTCCV